jgi:hypothetical protein
MEMLIHSRKLILMGMSYGFPYLWEPGRRESDHHPIGGLDRPADQHMLWQMGEPSPPFLWDGQASRPADAVADGELTTLSVG